MDYGLDIDTVTLLVGVVALIIGVLDARRTHKQSLKQHRLQIIMSISNSFTSRWESSWENILDDLQVTHLDDGLETLPDHRMKEVRHMLNWIDWVGAMKASDTLEDLTILTDSIGVPMKRIINAGKPIILSDTQAYSADYWKNLLLIARLLGIPWATRLSQ